MQVVLVTRTRLKGTGLLNTDVFEERPAAGKCRFQHHELTALSYINMLYG